MFRVFKVTHENVNWKPEGFWSSFRRLSRDDSQADQINVAVNFATDFYAKFKKKNPQAKHFRVLRNYWEGEKFIVEIEVEI